MTFNEGDIVFATREANKHHTYTTLAKLWAGYVTRVTDTTITCATLTFTDGSYFLENYTFPLQEKVLTQRFSPEPQEDVEAYKQAALSNKDFDPTHPKALELADILYERTKGKKTKAKKEIAIDTKQLNRLVIPEDKKKSIVEVLEQHKYEAKIFDKWGLKDTIEYGRGMTMLFWGPPGTGKTWATTCIAKALGKEVISIGAAEIQSSEPGGANRAIQEAFATAKKENKVLFLDECDSLITDRKQVGMILGSEINTLLTEIERFEGVCVLATNRIDTLDPALERRISLIMEFPEPDYEGRKAIWKNIIPKKFPLDKGVTFDELAEYALTGGLIKNALLNVARAAASEKAKKVTMKHFDTGIKKVLKSQGLMGKDQGRSRAVPSVAPEKMRDTVRDVTTG